MTKAMNIVEVAKRFDPWALGDALLQDIPIGPDGVNSGVWHHLDAAVKEILKVTGETYTIQTLRRHRMISASFPPERRLSGISYAVHDACGTPARLHAVITAWKSSPHSEARLSLRECRRILRAMHDTQVMRLEAAISGEQ